MAGKCTCSTFCLRHPVVRVGHLVETLSICLCRLLNVSLDFSCTRFGASATCTVCVFFCLCELFLYLFHCRVLTVRLSDTSSCTFCWHFVTYFSCDHVCRLPLAADLLSDHFSGRTGKFVCKFDTVDVRELSELSGGKILSGQKRYMAYLRFEAVSV